MYKTLDNWSRDMFNFIFLEKGLGIVSPAHFVHDFSRKNFLTLYYLNLPNLIFWSPLLLEILDNMWNVIVYFPGCDAINFEINLIFLIKPFFIHGYKVMTKILISWEWIELLWWNKKHFSSFLRGFQMPKIVSDLRVCL